jgi:tRNA-2-methylthio-N6-dimethylallyladenosine synthase
MNVHDSRRIEAVLERAGWQPTDEPTVAELVVFNTCSVREKAEHKLLSVLGTVRRLKESRPELVVAVAGCVAQQEGERLLVRAPVVDVVIGPDNIPELPNLVEFVRQGGPPVVRTVFDVDEPRFLEAVPGVDRREREVSSFVTVMKGCDERCTFCVVPFTRGPERYRPAEAIIAEIRAMAERGVREVILLGQTVNSWYEPGTDRRAPESRFAYLLRRIAAEVPEIRRLRYTSPHPRHVTDDLIRAHAELAVLPAHVHLPVQSGSNRILKRMLRRYTREQYVARAHALMKARPGLTLSTDLIVGFPGETEADFEETLSLVREVGFVAAFAFKYSPRPNTPALKLGDDVPEAVKDERLARLLELIGAQQRAYLESLVGTRTETLIEGPSSEVVGEQRRWKGRSSRYEIVHVDVPAELDLRGEIVEVEIVRANAHSLIGRPLVPLDRVGARRVDPAASGRAPSGRIRLPVVGRRMLAGGAR